MSYQDQQRKVQAERQERERRKVKDELEQQNEQARKASAFDDARSHHRREPSPEPLVLIGLDRHSSFSSLSMDYEQIRTVGNRTHEMNGHDRLGIQRSEWRRRKQSIPTSPLDLDNASFLDDRYANDTTIPFFDDDPEQLSNDATSRSRHDSRVEDNDSNETVSSHSSVADRLDILHVFFQLCPRDTYSLTSHVSPRSDSMATSTRSKSTLTFTSSNVTRHLSFHIISCTYAFTFVLV